MSLILYHLHSYLAEELKVIPSLCTFRPGPVVSRLLDSSIPLYLPNIPPQYLPNITPQYPPNIPLTTLVSALWSCLLFQREFTAVFFLMECDGMYIMYLCGSRLGQVSRLLCTQPWIFGLRRTWGLTWSVQGKTILCVVCGITLGLGAEWRYSWMLQHVATERAGDLKGHHLVCPN